MIKSRCGGYKKDIRPRALPGEARAGCQIEGGVNEEKKHVSNTFHHPAASVYYLRGSKKIIKKKNVEVEKNEGNSVVEEKRL